MNLDTVNERAQSKFAQLRTKLKLDLQKPILKDMESKALKDLQEFAERPIPQDVRSFQPKDATMQLFNKAKQENEFVDRSFTFIENLNLSNNLSLAIGLLISGHKTNNKEEYANAIEAIQKEIQKYG